MKRIHRLIMLSLAADLAVSLTALGAPRYPDTSPLPPHLLAYDNATNGTRIRMDILPAARLGETLVEYSYYFRVRSVSGQGLDSIRLWVGPERGHEVSDIRRPSREWFVRPPDRNIWLAPDFMTNVVKRSLFIDASSEEGGKPSPGSSGGPVSFRSNALPGVVSIYYFGWTSPFREVVELGEGRTIPDHPVGPAVEVITPIYGSDGRQIGTVTSFRGPREPDPIPPGKYYLSFEDQQILKRIYGDFPLGVADSTVGAGIIPDDVSTEQLAFRLQSLVEEARGLGWVGEEAAEKLADRARAARRKIALGEGHARAAWAKLLSFRDELRDAHDEWIAAHEEESRDRAGEHRVRGRREEAEIPFIPEYDDSPIGEDAADERAWALLEPNVRYLLDRLSPPAPPGRGQGPGMPRDEEWDR